MSALTAYLDTLRGRFVRLRARRPLTQTFAVEIGVSINSLKLFARGERVGLQTIQRLEAWCDAQETREALLRQHE